MVVKLICNLSLAALVCASALPTVAESQVGAGKPLSAAVQGKVEWASFSDADTLYNETIKSAISIEQQVARLQADSTGSATEQAARLHLASLLQWRHGQLDDALDTIDQALQLGRYGVLLRQQGRLLDAAGKTAEAVQAYREAVPLLSGEARRDTALRLALMTSTASDITPLLALAEGSDRVLQNRIALALAVLGHPGDAARLLTLEAGASARDQLRHHLCLAEWALQDLDAATAQRAAWEAVQRSQSREDRLYALALLTESHRNDGSLNALVDKLGGAPALSDDARSLWVSLLRETGRAGEALAALKDRAQRESAAVKRQLIGIYREAGEVQRMVAELSRLMVTDPTETIWPQGVSEYHLQRGDTAAAKTVWQGFIDRNEQPGVLLAGAAVMQTLNFDELALAAAKRAQQTPSAQKKAALFRFDLYLERGRQEDAQRVLTELEQTLAADDPLRNTVALCFERLSMPVEALRVMTAFVESGAGQGGSARQYLAQLQINAGEPALAMTGLMASLADTAPSQRGLVMTRIIQAATAAGQRPQLVAALGEKVAAGQAADWESQLLIEIHLRDGDGDKALALLERLYRDGRGDPIAELTHRAAVHRTLGDSAAYDRVLGELARRDPDNAVFHIRGRIANYIDKLRFEAGSDREVYATLSGLLEEYAQVSGKGAAREFQAGVLSMAGQRQQALEMFREILAEDDSRVDNYLAIGNQLQAMRRQRQAIAMYQYLIESSVRDDISWAALDGILNLGADRETLRWAQRQALEKLTAMPDKFDYYRQLADLSADLDDPERQRLALHNSLSADPELRMATLRELLRFTSTAGQGATGSTGGLSPDAGQHVLYGRRLLALGMALPPDVYISLGKAMLDDGDTQAALQAVAQAVEHTGSRELLMQAANIFAVAQDDVSARALYEKALIGNPTDLELQVLAARANERLGLTERAGELYLSGLTDLLDRQRERVAELVVPASATGPDQPLDRVLLLEGKERMRFGSASLYSPEYHHYYVPLRNGFMRLLPKQPDARQPLMDGLWRRYEQAWTAREKNHDTALPRLANYPRLRGYGQLMRYLSFSVGDYAAVDRLDQALLAAFPQDPLLAEILVSHRLEWGSSGYLATLDGYRGVSQRQRQRLRRHWQSAIEQTAPDLTAVKVVDNVLASEPSSDQGLSAEQAALKQALRRAIKANNPDRVLAAALDRVAAGEIWETLEAVERVLDKRQRKRLAERVKAILHRDRRLAYQSLQLTGFVDTNSGLSGWPMAWAEKLSDWLGRRLYSEEQLLAILAAGPGKTAGNTGVRAKTIDPWYLFHALSGDRQITWLKRLGHAEESETANLFQVLMARLMARPLSADIKAVVVEVSERQQLEYFSPWLATVDIHRQNLGLARQLAGLYRRQYKKLIQDPVFEPNLLRSEGQLDAALDALVTLYFTGVLPVRFPSPNGPSRNTSGLLTDYRHTLIKGNEQALLDRVEAYPCDTEAMLADRNQWLMDLYRATSSGNGRTLLAKLETLLAKSPDHIPLLREVERLRRHSGRKFAAVQALENEMALLPADEKNRRSQQLAQRFAETDHPIKELRWRGGSRAGSGSQARPLFSDVYAALSGDDETAMRRALGRLWQRVNKTEAVIHRDDSGLLTQSLSLDDLAAARPKPGVSAATPLLQQVAASAVGVEVLEAWLADIRGRFLEQSVDVIEALADAYRHQGVAGERFAALSRSIRERQAGDKEISLWLVLAAKQPALVQSPEALGILSEYAVNPPALRPALLRLTARAFAAQGDQSQALKHYRSLTRWSLEQEEIRFRFENKNRYGMQQIVADAVEVLDRQHQYQLYAYVLGAPPPREEHLKLAYGEFVLELYESAGDRGQFYSQFAASVEAALSDLVQGVATHSNAPGSIRHLYRVAGLQAQLGNQAAALEALKQALVAEALIRKNRLLEINSGNWLAPRLRSDFYRYRVLLGLEAQNGHRDLPGRALREGGLEWLQRVDVDARRWIDRGEVDRNGAIDLLLAVLKQYRVTGMATETSDLFDYLKRQLAYRKDISDGTMAAIISAGVELGNDINVPDLEQALLIQGAFKPQNMAAVIQRIAKRHGPQQALEVGAPLLEFTLDDLLLTELIALADRSGRQQQASEWRLLQKKAQLARRELHNF